MRIWMIRVCKTCGHMWGDFPPCEHYPRTRMRDGGASWSELVAVRPVDGSKDYPERRDRTKEAG